MSSENGASPSLTLARKVIFAAFNILKEEGGQLPVKDLMKKVEQRAPFSAWDEEVYEKTGYVRWQTVMRFYSIDCVKAGFIVKKKGIWFLTKDGEEALALGETGLLAAANKAYREWDKSREPENGIDGVDGDGSSEKEQDLTIETMEQHALEGFQSYVEQLNPYEFQDLVAALLRGMGYFTPFVAPRGKDGGVDVIAYRDPLGTVHPRIKVQVKHRAQNPATVQEIRQLLGLLQKDGDVGMFVSSGGFTSDAKASALSAHVHMELVDFQRFISLWQDFYDKMSDEDKNLLPLRPVYFLAPQD